MRSSISERRGRSQRRGLFLVTLTALQFRYPPGAEPDLITWLKRWLGGWPGIGRITTGMARHGYDLSDGSGGALAGRPSVPHSFGGAIR
jgi:hypothetical protein